MTELVGENLCFRYGRSEVLRGIHVSLTLGSVHALVGPSGSGKSTLLSVLAGLAPPASGRVVLRDHGSESPVTRPLKSLGMVFQPSGLWEHLTVEQHLRLVLSGSGLGRADRVDRIDQVLDSLSLSPLRRRRPGQLSTGQRQRLSIARAIVARPRWLLLDEPLAHLDGENRAVTLDLLRGVLAHSGAAVLMATHQPDEAMRLADTITILLDGRVEQSGPTREVYHRPATLAAARALGPASVVEGIADRGELLILRPSQMTFTPTPDGPARITRCEFLAGRFLLTAQAGPRGDSPSDLATRQPVLIEHPTPVAPGTLGHIALADLEPNT